MSTLSVVILTRDEEANIVPVLDSLKPLGAHVFIVDSGSTDNTVALAKTAGATVVHHPFSTYADQLNWALDHLPIRSDWVMRLDADERLTPELAEELPGQLVAAETDVVGFELKRRVYFWGRWIKHGGYYPTWLFRVWRRGAARSEQRWMDEHMVTSGGRIARLRHDIIDENHKGLTFWVDKHNRYADREVRDILALGGQQQESTLRGQARMRRWLKERVYVHAPPFVRPVAYWAFRYFVRLGILDGVPGFVFHFNQALWYRLLVDAKLHELKRSNECRSPGGSSSGGAV